MYLKKPRVNENGYVTVVLTKSNKGKTFYVHQLVAQNFIENKENKPYVNHKNSIRNDNHVINLEWSTPKENAKHMSAMGRGTIKQVEQYDLSGNFLRNYSSVKEVSLLTNLDYDTLLNVLRGKILSYGGYQWKYSNDEKIITTYHNNKSKSIKQFSMFGEYLRSFGSAYEAESYLQNNGFPKADAGNISRACCGNSKYCCDSQWRFSDDDTALVNLRKRHKNKVVQLTSDNELLKIFNSVMGAARTFNPNALSGGGISKCCNGRQETAYGFKWMFEEDYKKTLT